ncbi:hypothetical protein GCM10025862_13020 [Arsenicicoccus piscis]|uniref:SAM-dependent MTase RsmB/NOP-type domain-containing protein n=1 Tax=Arsenicicoccus piscis TaxID=673954 RepID=A0ABQ6HLK2_9MICO|nr:hypothetical protein GCM10025862_13020 [Arsenicicoccus piscis]
MDLCAGPGGKAGVLAGLSLERGATLIANEVSRHRAELVQATVREAVERGADVEVQVGDGRHVGEDEPGVYDRVLVDAPCTGLGALRRRPDARWRRESGDVPVLASLQRELLNSALDATRPGGVVGYATCSPHLNETEYVVKDVLKHRDDASWLDARPVLAEVAPGVEVAGEGPALQLWPHQHGTDAMYLALLRKH